LWLHENAFIGDISAALPLPHTASHLAASLVGLQSSGALCHLLLPSLCRTADNLLRLIRCFVRLKNVVTGRKKNLSRNKMK
jgi:hypothetical protein